MATPNSLRILEVSHVAPSNSASKFSLPLTFFDTLWFKFHPVERLFFYSLSDTNSTESFLDSILPKLKHSLSLTLNHFLPLAGNLTWPQDSPKPTILYTPGDGVSLTVAESTSNSDFSLLVSRIIHNADALRPLVPQLSVSDTTVSAIAVQITVFPNGAGGFCVGITTHHAVLDGKSTVMFMKSWAYLCKELKENKNEKSSSPLLFHDELTPFYDRTIINDSTGLDMSFLNQWLTNNSEQNSSKLFEFFPTKLEERDLVRGSFELTRSNLEKLQQKVSRKSNKLQDHCPNTLRLSSFVLTFAYALVCLLKATDHNKKSNRKKVYFLFTADYRNRTQPPVPENYFGNYVGPHMSFSEGRDLLQRVQEYYNDDDDDDDTVLSGTTIIAAKLSELIVKELVESEDVLGGLEEKARKIGILASRSDVQVIGVAGSPRFGVYGVDFGWGRPEKVDIASVDGTGSISMAESRDGSKGVEVGLALKKHEMDLFASLFHSNLETLKI